MNCAARSRPPFCAASTRNAHYSPLGLERCIRPGRDEANPMGRLPEEKSAGGYRPAGGHRAVEQRVSEAPVRVKHLIQNKKPQYAAPCSSSQNERSHGNEESESVVDRRPDKAGRLR